MGNIAQKNNSHFKICTGISVSCKTLRELSLLINLAYLELILLHWSEINKLNSCKVLHDTDILV